MVAFIDCTFGQGGYTEKILEFPKTKVIAFDRDSKSKNIAIKFKQNFKIFEFYNKNLVISIVLNYQRLLMV